MNEPKRNVRCPICSNRHFVLTVATTDDGEYRVLECEKHEGKPYAKLRNERKRGIIVLPKEKGNETTKMDIQA